MTTSRNVTYLHSTFGRAIIFCTLFTLYLVFTIYVYTIGTETNSVMNTQAMRGKELFQKYNCGTCHQIYGLGGYLGPELTDIISKPGRTRSYLKAIMNSGTGQMPEFNLTNEQTDQILAYLEYIGGTVPGYKKLITDGRQGITDACVDVAKACPTASAGGDRITDGERQGSR